jgi:hypothetical protein
MARAIALSTWLSRSQVEIGVVLFERLPQDIEARKLVIREARTAVGAQSGHFGQPVEAKPGDAAFRRQNQPGSLFDELGCRVCRQLNAIDLETVDIGNLINFSSVPLDFHQDSVSLRTPDTVDRQTVAVIVREAAVGLVFFLRWGVKIAIIASERP